MRFAIKYIQPASEMLNLAFKHARQSHGSFSKRMRKKERWAKEIEKTKLEGISEELDEKLIKVVQSFPSFEILPPFYKALIDATIGLGETRRRLGNVKRTAKLVQKMRREHLGKIFKSKTDYSIKKLSRAFYGRVSSMMKKLEPDMLELEKARKELERLPDLRTDCFTVLIAGYPNVGKTTLLHRLTGSKPHIAAYPFTTLGIKTGFFKDRYFDFQALDLPGLLDRTKVNPIEQKALSALRYLDGVVVFVVDPSLYSGFTLEQQAALFSSLRKTLERKKFIIAMNKLDLSTPEQLEHAGKLFGEFVSTKDGDETIKAQIVSLATQNSKFRPSKNA